MSKPRSSAYWHYKIVSERLRLKHYAARYAESIEPSHDEIMEKDIERSIRALAHAKRQHERSIERECKAWASQTEQDCASGKDDGDGGGEQ